MYYFKKGQTSSGGYTVYGNDAVTEHVGQKCFIKFHAVDFNNVPRSGRPTDIDSTDFKTNFDANSFRTFLDIDRALHISHKTEETGLRQMGYVSCLNHWVSQKLTKSSLINRISIAIHC